MVFVGRRVGEKRCWGRGCEVGLLGELVVKGSWRREDGDGLLGFFCFVNPSCAVRDTRIISTLDL